MTNTSNKTENLLPFNVIAAATNGDTDAICAILKLQYTWVNKIQKFGHQLV